MNDFLTELNLPRHQMAQCPDDQIGIGLDFAQEILESGQIGRHGKRTSQGHSDIGLGTRLGNALRRLDDHRNAPLLPWVERFEAQQLLDGSQRVPGDSGNPIAGGLFNRRTVGFGFEIIDVYADNNRSVLVEAKRFYVALG
jgi:hypothetical protein